MQSRNEANPICTVVIPCFNYGRYVFEAIDSILNQTIPNLQVIVVDGGSTDQETISKLKAYQHERVEIYFREGRHLVGSNRNFGIEKAKTKYICCLDADDALESTYIEKAIYMMEVLGYDIVSTSLRFVGAQAGVGNIYQYPDLRLMVTGNHVHTCAVFKKSMWESVGGFFDVGLGKDHIAEDWDFWIRSVALGARVRNISKEPLLIYRVHPSGSLSHSSDNPSLQDQLKYILNRNVSLITPEAFDRSVKAKELKIFNPLSESSLCKSMLEQKKDESTVMLVLPWLLVGGAERLVTEVVKFLRSKDRRVVVITTKPQDGRAGSSEEWVKKWTDELYMLPNFLEPAEFCDFVKYLLKSRGPSHVLLGGSPEFYEMIPKLKEVSPNTLFVDFLFNTIGHVGSHSKYRQYFDFVVAENSEVVEWFKSIGWSSDRIFRLSSGIDLSEYYPRNGAEEARRKLGISDDDVVVGFSGRLSEEKAPDAFLDIASRFGDYPNIKFVMTGGGYLSEHIQQRALAMSNSKNFFFCGLVDDVKEYLRSFDILILPSIADGRPFVVMEAMASGVAILASRVGGIPDMVVDGRNGYIFDPKEIDEFQRGVLDLALNQEKLKRFKISSREMAEHLFNCDEVYSGLDEFLNRTVVLEKI